MPIPNMVAAKSSLNSQIAGVTHSFDRCAQKSAAHFASRRKESGTRPFDITDTAMVPI
ncbi:MAG: hypothetical protein ONB24_10600 [candidate division KSB1 bacterium]|nr:hypothetical protein [candidate division KSB1 bacterium]